MTKDECEQLVDALTSRIPKINKDILAAQLELSKAESKFWSELKKLPNWGVTCTCREIDNITTEEEEEIFDNQYSMVDYNNGEYANLYCMLCGGHDN